MGGASASPARSSVHGHLCTASCAAALLAAVTRENAAQEDCVQMML